MIGKGILRTESARIVLIYFALSFLYIALSDAVLSVLVTDPVRFAEISIYKGWIYTIVMSIVIFVLLIRWELQNNELLRRLRMERQQLSFMSDNVADPVAMYSANGRIEAATMVFSKRFGSDPKTLSGKKSEDIFAHATALKIDTLIQQAIILRTSQRAEIGIPGLESQTETPFDVIASPMQHDDSSTMYVILTFHDVSSFKETQGRHAGLFVGVVSHLVSPLETMYGSLKALIRKHPDNADLRQDLTELSTENGSALSLAKDLLFLYDVMPGMVHKINKSPITIPSAVARVLSGLKSATDDRRITIVTELEPQLHDALGDPTRFDLCLSKILMYAIVASSEQATIVITAESEPGFVRLTIRDSGPGIPYAEQNRIYEPFFCPSTMNGCAPCTGLELPIAKILVESWGGQLSINSIPGKRTTFSWTIPAAG